MADWTAVERCRKPSGFGRRHLLATLGFVGFALSYAMRFSLSIAIVAMVNTNTGEKTNQIGGNLSFASSQKHVLFKSDVCPHDTSSHAALDLKLNLYHTETTFVDKSISYNSDKGEQSFEVGPGTNGSITLEHSKNGHDYSVYNETEPVAELMTGSLTNENSHREHNEDQQGEFLWNERQQGIILGSFFWGYVLTQSLGGWISQRFGGKWPFGIGLLITGIFATVTPFAARLGGMPAVMFVRVIQGLAGGVTIPSMQNILSKWFPPEERGKLGSFTLAGMPFGTFISTLCSGFLIHYFGWASVFYLTGILTVIWFVFWSCCAYANPCEDPSIDQMELHYIQAALQQPLGPAKSSNSVGDEARQHIQSQRKAKVPWTSVLLSPAFWAILVCNTCETWQLYTINAELPTYMKSVLHFDIKQNSVMSAFPHLLTLIVSIILTNVGDRMIEHKYLSIGTVRKLSTSIAMWGSAAALVGAAYSGCDRVKTVALLATAIGANGGKFGGFLVNIIDIAPNYAGILMGIINTISSVPGILAPWTAGWIINGNPSLENWRLVFLITAAISFFGNLIFVLFSSGVQQSWNNGPSSDEDDDCGERSNCGIGKTLDSSPSSLERINPVILSNNGTIRHSNKTKECENNGLYPIPLNPPVELVLHLHHEEQHFVVAPPQPSSRG